jgi:hypothetical protein
MKAELKKAFLGDLDAARGMFARRTLDGMFRLLAYAHVASHARYSQGCCKLDRPRHR